MQTEEVVKHILDNCEEIQFVKTLMQEKNSATVGSGGNTYIPTAGKKPKRRKKKYQTKEKK